MMHTMVDQSYLLSSIDLFYLSGWLAVLVIPLCFLVKRPAAGAAPVAAAD
jgi:DHA2 family multidrug resistance protein